MEYFAMYISYLITHKRIALLLEIKYHANVTFMADQMLINWLKENLEHEHKA